MKIHAKMENGRPLLIFPDQRELNNRIQVYSAVDGHCSASRAYLRSLPEPASGDEIAACRAAIHAYTRR